MAYAGKQTPPNHLADHDTESLAYPFGLAIHGSMQCVRTRDKALLL